MAEKDLYSNALRINAQKPGDLNLADPELAGEVQGGLSAREQAIARGEVPSRSYLPDDDAGFIEGLRDEIGRTGGSIAGGIKGAQYGAKVPGPPWVKGLGALVGGATGAGIGAFGGEAAQQGVEAALETERAPQSLDQAISRAGKAAGEEAAMDLLFGGALKAGSKLWQLVLPSFKKAPSLQAENIYGREKYQLPDGRTEYTAEELNEELISRGGGLAVGHLTGAEGAGRLIQVMDSALRNAVIGSGGFKTLDELNEKGIQEWSQNLSDELFVAAQENLSREGIGLMVQNALRVGQEVQALKEKQLFKALDDSFSRIVPGAKIKVNVRGVREAAARMANEYKDLGAGSAHASTIRELNRIADGSNSLSFEQAQDLRSAMLSTVRRVKGSMKDVEKGTEGLVPSLNQLQGQVLGSIDRAAKASGNQDFVNQYEAVRKFVKKNAQHADAEFVGKLVNNTDPEKLGESIATKGSVQDVKKLRDALRWADRYSSIKSVGGVDVSKAGAKVTGRDSIGRVADVAESTDFPTVWQSFQSGYLKSLVERTADSATGIPSGKKLLNAINDPKNMDTFKEIFTGAQRESIEKFAHAAKLAQEKGSSELSMAMRFSQLAAIGSLVTGATVYGGTDYGAAAAGALVGAGALGRILSSPKVTRAAIKVVNYKPDTPVEKLVTDPEFYKAVMKTAYAAWRADGNEGPLPSEAEMQRMLFNTVDPSTTMNSTDLVPPEVREGNKISPVPTAPIGGGNGEPAPIGTPEPQPRVAPSGGQAPAAQYQNLFPYDSLGNAAAQQKQQGIGSLR